MNNTVEGNNKNQYTFYGIVFGVLPFITLVSIYSYFNVYAISPDTFWSYTFHFYNNISITFNITSLLLPILFSFLSISITYIVFKSVNPTPFSFNICSFAIIHYLSKLYAGAGNVYTENATIVQGQQVVTILIITCLIMLLVIYQAIKNQYIYNITQIILGNPNPLFVQTFKSYSNEFLSDVLFSIQTANLWNYRKKPTTITKSLLKAIVKERNNNEEEYHDAIQEIDKLDFTMSTCHRLGYSALLSFVTSLSLILNGIKVVLIEQ